MQLLRIINEGYQEIEQQQNWGGKFVCYNWCSCKIVCESRTLKKTDKINDKLD